MAGTSTVKPNQPQFMTTTSEQFPCFPIPWAKIGLKFRLMHCADEVLPLASKHDLGLYRAAAMIWRGWCLSALARADQGIPLLSAGLAA
jgi:hypothetical protein